jgi:hypothetical protein
MPIPAPSITRASTFLRAFGYLPTVPVDEGAVFSALRAYRSFRGLPTPDEIDEPLFEQTLEDMRAPRCAVGDQTPDQERARAWLASTKVDGVPTITYRWGDGTGDIKDQPDEWAAVRLAMDTWETVGIRFIETTDVAPEFETLWLTVAVLPDITTLASADYPRVAIASKPRRLRFFDNRDWRVTGGDYDVETVALHELGHILGLDHLDNDGCHTVMCSQYRYGKVDLTPRDRERFKALHGP